MFSVIKDAYRAAKGILSFKEDVSLGNNRYELIFLEGGKNTEGLKGGHPVFVAVDGRLIRYYENMPLGPISDGLKGMVEESKNLQMPLIADVNGYVVVVGPQTSPEEALSSFKNYRSAEAAVRNLFSPKPSEPGDPTASLKGQDRSPA